MKSPTQAASKAWVFGILSRVRLNLVCPPVKPCAGIPSFLDSLKIACRVMLTAAASRKGVFA